MAPILQQEFCAVMQDLIIQDRVDSCQGLEDILASASARHNHSQLTLLVDGTNDTGDNLQGQVAAQVQVGQRADDRGIQEGCRSCEGQVDRVGEALCNLWDDGVYYVADLLTSDSQGGDDWVAGTAGSECHIIRKLQCDVGDRCRPKVCNGNAHGDGVGGGPWAIPCGCDTDGTQLQGQGCL